MYLCIARYQDVPVSTRKYSAQGKHTREMPEDGRLECILNCAL